MVLYRGWGNGRTPPIYAPLSHAHHPMSGAIRWLYELAAWFDRQQYQGCQAESRGGVRGLPAFNAWDSTMREESTFRLLLSHFTPPVHITFALRSRQKRRSRATHILVLIAWFLMLSMAVLTATRASSGTLRTMPRRWFSGRSAVSRTRPPG